MRILMVVFNQVGKGTYWRAFHLGRFLVQRGHSVTLMAMSPQARLRLTERSADNLRIVETPDWLPGSLRSGWDPWDTGRRLMWLGNEAFDLVHAFEARPVVIFPALAAKRRGAKLVMDWCDWFGRGGSVEERPSFPVRLLLRPVETFFEESFRPKANGTTVINTLLYEKAVQLGIPPERILLLPNGADVEHIRPQNRNAVRQRLGLPSDIHIIAYTGAIFMRDARLMAAAFDQICAQRQDVRLLLIGYCNAQIEQMVRAPEAIWRTGPVSQAQLADYLSASDIGWLPFCDSGANRGRYPMKLNDFLAAGLAVVATDVGDVGRLLREEPVGLVVPDEPDLLAGAAQVLLDDASERTRRAEWARKVAETRFAWPKIAEQAEGFYGAVLKG